MVVYNDHLYCCLIGLLVEGQMKQITLNFENANKEFVEEQFKNNESGETVFIIVGLNKFWCKIIEIYSTVHSSGKIDIKVCYQVLEE